jgi:hypothetical protein
LLADTLVLAQPVIAVPAALSRHSNVERDCAESNRESSITMFYPPQLAPFFTDKSLLRAFEQGGFLGSKLGADVGM